MVFYIEKTLEEYVYVE
jgi:predicted SpoU family rRNA methylase